MDQSPTKDFIVISGPNSKLFFQHIMNVLELAKVEGVPDEELGHIIRRCITDLKDIRQNVITHRKVELSALKNQL